MSFATINWIDVFTRQMYLDVLADSVIYCRKEKCMELYCYCFMPSHIHFIFRSANELPSELLRDFKGHTSKKTIEAIENNPQESRKEWLLWIACLERSRKIKRAEKIMQLQVNINFGNTTISLSNYGVEK